MNACVVDASVAIKWFVAEIHFDLARRLLDGLSGTRWAGRACWIEDV